MKAKNLKTIFIHSWGSFPATTLMSIGMTHKEVVKYCNKNTTKNYQNWIKNDESVKKAFIENNGGVFVYGTNDYKGDDPAFSILIMKEFEDAWVYWEILMHELHHAVYWVTKKFNIGEETEAQAYTFDQVFRKTRRILQKLD